MSYATYVYTSLDQLLNETKLELRLDHTNTEDIYLSRFLLQGAKEMMTKLDFLEKTAVLPIDCFIAELPCDFVIFDRPHPLVFTTNGQVLNSAPYYCCNFTIIHTGNAFITASPFQNFNCRWGIPTLNIQNGKIYFSNNVDAHECTISYLGLNIDENGKLQIPQINSRPLIAYACYKYKRSINQSFVDYQKEWILAKSHRKGLANLPDWFQRQQLSRIMNSLL